MSQQGEGDKGQDGRKDGHRQCERLCSGSDCEKPPDGRELASAKLVHFGEEGGLPGEELDDADACERNLARKVGSKVESGNGPRRSSLMSLMRLSVKNMLLVRMSYIRRSTRIWIGLHMFEAQRV